MLSMEATSNQKKRVRIVDLMETLKLAKFSFISWYNTINFNMYHFSKMCLA